MAGTSGDIGDVQLLEGNKHIGQVGIDSIEGSLPAGDNNIGNVDVATMPVVETRDILIDVDTALSGQITVTTAGTEVQGGNVPLPNGVFIKALAANTGKIYVGNDGAGAISSSTGFELSAGELIIILVDNLNKLWFDASVNAQKVCWIKA